MNGTDLTADDEIIHVELSLWLKVLLATYLTTIQFFGVASNTVAAIIYGRTSPKSACDWLILTMSITDAFVCLFSPALYLRSCLRIPFPWKTSIFCTLEYWLQLTAMTASCMLLAIIALDRYVKICRPSLASLTPVMAKSVCIITVFVSAIVCLTPFLHTRKASNCYISEIRNTGVTKVFFTCIFGCFVVSFVIVVFAYASVCKKISQKIKLKQRLIENSGLHSPAHQDGIQDSPRNLLRDSNMWSRMFSRWPVMWKKMSRVQENNNKTETERKPSSEGVYTNGNIDRNKDDGRIQNIANDWANNEETVFLSTDLKSDVWTGKSTQYNFGGNNTSYLPGNKIEMYSIGKSSTQPEGSTSNDCVNYSETSSKCPVNETVEERSLKKREEIINRSSFTQRDDSELTYMETRQDDCESLSLTFLEMRKSTLDNVGSVSQLATSAIIDSVTAPCSREPDMFNNATLAVANVDKKPGCLLSGNSSHPHTSAYLQLKSVGNIGNPPGEKHTYVPINSDSIDIRNNNVANTATGHKSLSPTCHSSGCVLPNHISILTNTAAIKNAYSDPNIDLIKSAEEYPCFRFLNCHSSHVCHSRGNTSVSLDGVEVELSRACDLMLHRQLKNKMAVPRVLSSNTKHCTGCLHQSWRLHVSNYSNLFCNLATCVRCQRLVKSCPCLSWRTDGTCVSVPVHGETTTSNRQILDPKSHKHRAFQTICLTNEGPFALCELSDHCSSTNEAMTRRQKGIQTGLLLKHPNIFFHGNCADSSAAGVDSGSVSRKDAPNSTSDTAQELAHSEMTNSVSLLFPRHPPRTALRPTGSTTSRTSNKSSSFADPIRTTVMIDVNKGADDTSEMFSDVSTSPPGFGCRRLRLKRRRSGSSQRSTTSSKMRFARERQMTFMLLSVTAAFLLSWLPPWGMYMTSLYGPEEYSRSAVIQYLGTIHLLNYVASPVIYFTFNPTFRSKVSQLLARLFKFRCFSR